MIAMKQRFEVLLIVIVCLMQATSLQAQDSLKTLALTFDKALEMTLQNSHSLKQQSYLVQEKDQAMKASRGLYLPKIGVAATYAHMAKDITMDLTPVKDAITPLYSALSNYGSFSGV